MSKLEKIQSEILSLSSEEKELLGIFMKDAQYHMDKDYHEAWQTELDKRLTEVKNGSVNFISSKSVVEELRKKISNE